MGVYIFFIKIKMRISQKGESLVWIIIGVTILSFVLVWIMNLVFQSQDVVDNFQSNRDISLLEENALLIGNVLNTSLVLEDEVFYVERNTSSNTYDIYTWTLNEWYKYIDSLGDTISNTWSYTWIYYERSFTLKRKTNPAGTVYTLITPLIEKAN